MDPSALTGHTLVLYDGVCGLCNRIVRFMLRFDTHDRFRYAALQGDFGSEILNRYGLNPAELDSVVLVTDVSQPSERIHVKFDAVLAAAKELGGVWRMAALARILPRSSRERLYDFIARHRYGWFGKYDACPIPKPEHRVKFVDHTK